MKKYILTLVILAIAIVSFIAGLFLNKEFGLSALSFPISDKGQSSIYTCVDTKCVVVKDQCADNNDCVTHLECDKSRKCVSVKGVGKNECSNANDCALVKNPQQWCKEHNPGMVTTTIVYPNGNFSCMCYSTSNVSTRAQLSCKEQYQN